MNSLDSSKVYFFYNNFEKQGPGFLKEIDTLITNIEKYDPLTKPNNYYAALGNTGLASVDMVYKPYLTSGFNFGIHSFDKYLFHNDSIKYYWVGRPYTQLFYIMGSKKEQNLHVDHSQNVASWFNIGLYFRYVNSPGYYINQKADDKNFVLKTRFQTRNYRYMVLANYIHNKVQVEENGGIKYDSVFEQNIITSRDGIEVNLTGAHNRLKENSFYVKQLFKISGKESLKPADTIKPGKTHKISPGVISYSILLSKFTYLYEDNFKDSSFYHFTFDTVNPSYDSTYIYKVENQISWTNADNTKDQLLTFNFALKYLYVENSIDSVRKIYNQLIPYGKVAFSISRKLKLDFYADYITGNSYVGDYNLTGKLSFNTKFGNLKYKVTSALQEAGRFYNYYSSNHFKWENNFRKQSFFINTFEYNYKNLQAGVKLINIGSFVYLDTLAIPAQLDNGMNIFNAYVRKLFNVGNWSFDTRIIYQNASNSGAIRLPELIGNLSVYYTKDLFKQAAILQTGIDAFYNTSYYGYSYMPATKSFYIQNEKEVGDYIYANVFLNLQIKRARLFLKYHNLGFLFKDFSYFTVPSYPMQDGGFRFGISWMFYD
ncbi:MAG: hypothetical protein H8D45_11150 [Bacteroidetes bacterium]|nr:hypothetical protein [Bacteroidota bacterium]